MSWNPWAPLEYISLKQADTCVFPIVVLWLHPCPRVSRREATMCGNEPRIRVPLCSLRSRGEDKSRPFTCRELKSHVSLSLRGGSCHRAATGLWSPSLSRSLTQSLLGLLSRPPKVSRLLLRCHTPNYSFSLSLFPLPLLWIESSPPPRWVQHELVLMPASGCGYEGWESLYICTDMYLLLLCFLTVQRLRTHVRLSSRYPSLPLLTCISKGNSSQSCTYILYVPYVRFVTSLTFLLLLLIIL